jgi:hypothetical protein
MLGREDVRSFASAQQIRERERELWWRQEENTPNSRRRSKPVRGVSLRRRLDRVERSLSGELKHRAEPRALALVTVAGIEQLENSLRVDLDHFRASRSSASRARASAGDIAKNERTSSRPRPRASVARARAARRSISSPHAVPTTASSARSAVSSWAFSSSVSSRTSERIRCTRSDAAISFTIRAGRGPRKEHEANAPPAACHAIDLTRDREPPAGHRLSGRSDGGLRLTRSIDWPECPTFSTPAAWDRLLNSERSPASRMPCAPSSC